MKNKNTMVYVGISLCLVLSFGVVGCSESHTPLPDASASVQQVSLIPEKVREKLLDGAMNVLSRLEDYDEQAAFSQIFDRLNQWSHGNPSADAVAVGDWSIDPLFSSLAEQFRSERIRATLKASVFDASTDVRVLRDQRWMADISEMARGDAIEDLEVAQNLFAWVVRNLAISTDPPMVPDERMAGSRWFLPGEILLSGRASAAQRSWVFLQLLRHAGLDGVMLATDSAGDTRPWLPALVSDGEAYLFEPTYGMPVPGLSGEGVATVRDAAADPQVLARLSLPEREYPVRAQDIQNLSILIAADPWLLSRRMYLLEKRMAGTRSLSLSLEPSSLGSRAAKAIASDSPEEVAVELWGFPWETVVRQSASETQDALRKELAVMTVTVEQPFSRDGIRQTRSIRPLFAARVREFRGDMNGAEGAKSSYLAARPSTAMINEGVNALPTPQADVLKRLYLQMKEDATYWLGVLTLSEGDSEASVDYLDRLTLQASPDSPWTDAARINLATALEHLGRIDEAVDLLRADESPQRFGSRIRAASMRAADQSQESE